MVLARLLAFIACFGPVAVPSMVRAQTADPVHVALQQEIAALCQRFAPFPLHSIRRSELDTLLFDDGYDWNDFAEAYRKRGPRSGEGRPPEYIVNPTFCPAAEGQDPWVKSLYFSADSIRGSEPDDFIEAVNAGELLPKISHVLDGDGFKSLDILATFGTFPPLPKGEPVLSSVQGEAVASEGYNQKIVLHNEMSCP